MTKKQFINKWWPACTTTFIDDIDTVIATEIEKAKVQPQPSDKVQISKHTLVEVNRAFRALKRDTESYVHKVFGDDGVFDAMKEISEAYKYYFGEYPTEQIILEPAEQPAPPMTYKEAVNLIISRKLTHKLAGNDSWFACGYCGKIIQFCDESGNDMIEVRFDELELTEWYPYKKPFDKDRFERMFRAVVASWEFENITEAIEQTEYNLNKLDAYYASKEGGNNG